ncbi:M14 family zinc carboxypeptidase [Pilimelia columellifera]|uniref:M14 family zinc carboxypeptidase n=1 Tax=Pilimelia columellifera subsp. columellifera TaxID=706583 RepID=A0ABN3NQ69_9ACTN
MTAPSSRWPGRRALAAVGVATAAALALPLLGAQTSANAQQAPAAQASAPQGYYLVARNGVDHSLLANRLDERLFDLVGHDDMKHGVQIVGTDADAAKLRAEGMSVTYLAPLHQPVPAAFAANADTYYGGYHTVEGHRSHNAAIVSANPTLARKHVIAQSWKKTVGKGGHDIEAVCITKIAAGDCELKNTGKPKFTVMSQMHARELASGELSYMLMDHLVANYGKAADVTSLLDTTEVWIIPIANPDGVDIVASNPNNPISQRKSAKENGCPGTGLGTDLNRNSSYHWDVNQGGKCSQTYPGTGPASDPEVAGIQKFLSKIYRDTKPAADKAPATADTTGVFITTHSYSQLNIFPYGWTNDLAPNHNSLKAIADAMARHNRYQVVHGDGGLNYFAPGATDDWVYGELGVPGLTIEIGPGTGACGGFFPKHSCMQDFWKLNYPAYMAAAKYAAKPYATRR